MAPKLRISLALASLLAVFLVIYDFWLWQPARQVRRHQAHLLQAAEEKRWTQLADFVDAHYRDRWGHDKAFVIRESREILRQFFVLTISSETISTDMRAEQATVIARLKLAGQGTASAEYARQAVNRLHEPFSFVWVRRSWKPWDWQLTNVDQPEIQLGEWND